MQQLLLLEVHCPTAHYGLQLPVYLLQHQEVLGPAPAPEPEGRRIKSGKARAESSALKLRSLSSQNESGEMREEVLVGVD